MRKISLIFEMFHLVRIRGVKGRSQGFRVTGWAGCFHGWGNGGGSGQ